MALATDEELVARRRGSGIDPLSHVVCGDDLQHRRVRDDRDRAAPVGEVDVPPGSDRRGVDIVHPLDPRCLPQRLAGDGIDAGEEPRLFLVKPESAIREEG